MPIGPKLENLENGNQDPPVVAATFHGSEATTDYGPWQVRDGRLVAKNHGMHDNPSNQPPPGDGGNTHHSGVGPAPGGGNSLSINIGVAVDSFIFTSNGIILVTGLGLWCVNQNGQPQWRLTEINDWAVSDGYLMAATPFGVRGYRLP